MISRTDLGHILKHVKFSELKGQSIFMTGGTGFIGKWMLESLLYANDKLNLGVKVVILTRNPLKFCDRFNSLVNHHTVELLQGDVRTFPFTKEKYSYLLHMATDENHRLTVQDPKTMYDIIANGTRHTLDFAYSNGVKKLLFISSGAVLSNETNSYVRGKQRAEELCREYCRDGLEVKIARGYCLVGAYLPLNKHFAIGNFIGDALDKRTIQIKGDGSPIRSYIYMADAAIWFWNILLNGESLYPYSVGSENEITIKDLARMVAQSAKVGVNVIGGKSASMQKYVPILSRERELGLRQYIDLSEAIKRTIQWYGRNGNDK